MRGTWREGSFTGDSERYAKALEMDVCFHGGIMEGRSFPRLFEKRDK